MLKMDVGIHPLIGVKDALSYPAGMLPGGPDTLLERMLDINTIQHPFTHVRLTVMFEIGIPLLADMLNPVAQRALRENCTDMLRGIERQSTRR